MTATKAKKSTEPKVSSLADFKSKSGSVVTLPSGLSMRLSSPGMTTFLQSGMVPNSLMGIITEAINTGKEVDMKKLALDDDESLGQMLQMIDAVTVRCAVEPRVHKTPTEEQDRDETVLYVDELDEYDKLFIFQWATGGTSNVTDFRKELDEHVDKLSDGQIVPGPAKRASRAKKRPS